MNKRNIYSEWYSVRMKKKKNESLFKLSFYAHRENLHIQVERISLKKKEVNEYIELKIICIIS